MLFERFGYYMHFFVFAHIKEKYEEMKEKKTWRNESKNMDFFYFLICELKQ